METYYPPVALKGQRSSIPFLLSVWYGLLKDLTGLTWPICPLLKWLAESLKIRGVIGCCLSVKDKVVHSLTDELTLPCSLVIREKAWNYIRKYSSMSQKSQRHMKGAKEPVVPSQTAVKSFCSIFLSLLVWVWVFVYFFMLWPCYSSSSTLLWKYSHFWLSKRKTNKHHNRGREKS